MNNKDNTKLNKIIGNRINTLLAQNNKSQKELAELLNVKPNVISYYCGGSRRPSIEQLTLIAECFNTTVDYLLGLTSIQTSDTSMKNICEYIGLSDKSISKLHQINNKSKIRAFSDLLSLLIEDNDFEYLLGLLEGYITGKNRTMSKTLETMSVVEYKESDIAQLAISSTITHILDRITIDFLSNYDTTEIRCIKSSIEKHQIKEEYILEWENEIASLISDYKKIIENSKN
jgi:transcriptional regulator with XRE-family HTH domain